ncbi:AraC family transcriptional regulator [Chitinophaga sp. Mgbs1]|uniref:AraC family transcriptional regulator n=1 Tax=Chitinophaga solisilvae TaxID=1233460 RepID=A0A3S1AYI3_9BACT|nr:AraC family transcriptional regulator [Chitinophaga solisilvae]
MPKPQSIEEFYQEKMNWLPDNLQEDIGHFNVFRLSDCLKDGTMTIQYSRRDFYKVSIIRGRYLYHYADKTIETTGTTLMFFNPQVPYAWESHEEVPEGYFCIFKESFFMDKVRGNLSGMPMFAPSARPFYSLDAVQEQKVTELFLKMLEEINSDYLYKYDLLRNYVAEIIHIALKMEPSEALYQHADAKTRITAVFTELLERQFPIETPAQQFKLRSASDFASQLSVHVNHLNRAIRETTGKTTTAHITERVTSEAKALLKHTNWNISEIGYCLGFEEPSHFNNFFKKQTSMTPSAYRDV